MDHNILPGIFGGEGSCHKLWIVKPLWLAIKFHLITVFPRLASTSAQTHFFWHIQNKASSSNSVHSLLYLSPVDISRCNFFPKFPWRLSGGKILFLLAPKLLLLLGCTWECDYLYLRIIWKDMRENRQPTFEGMQTDRYILHFENISACVEISGRKWQIYFMLARS